MREGKIGKEGADKGRKYERMREGKGGKGKEWSIPLLGLSLQNHNEFLDFEHFEPVVYLTWTGNQLTNYLICITEQVIDDWRFVSLVMDRLLLYVYMIVTVVATCTILIRTQTFFDQQDFKYEIAHERDCKQQDVKYRTECDDWYQKICLGEKNQLHPFFDDDEGTVLKQACLVYIGKL